MNHFRLILAFLILSAPTCVAAQNPPQQPIQVNVCAGDSLTLTASSLTGTGWWSYGNSVADTLRLLPDRDTSIWYFQIQPSGNVRAKRYNIIIRKTWLSPIYADTECGLSIGAINLMGQHTASSTVTWSDITSQDIWQRNNLSTGIYEATVSDAYCDWDVNITIRDLGSWRLMKTDIFNSYSPDYSQSPEIHDAIILPDSSIYFSVFAQYLMDKQGFIQKIARNNQHAVHFEPNSDWLRLAHLSPQNEIVAIRRKPGNEFSVHWFDSTLVKLSYHELPYTAQNIMPDIITDSLGNTYCAFTTTGNTGVFAAGKGEKDLWLAKFGPDHTLSWLKNYGGSRDDQAQAITFGPNQQVWIAGNSNSQDGDLPAKSKGGKDLWVLAVDQNDGSIQHSVRFGGSGEENAIAIMTDKLGKLLIHARSNSKDGDLLEAPNYIVELPSWILQIDTETPGKIEWQKFIRLNPKNTLIANDKAYRSIKNGDGYWEMVLYNDLFNPEIWGGYSRVLQFSKTDGEILHSQTVFTSLVLPNGEHYYDLSLTPNNSNKYAVKIRDFKPYNILPTLTSSMDTIVCPIQSVTLWAKTDAEQIYWSNGMRTDSITIDRPGIYTVSAFNAFACSNNDTIIVGMCPPKLIPDTISGCDSAFVSFSNPDYQFIWSDGSMATSRWFKQGGLYILRTSGLMGTERFDTLFVDVATNQIELNAAIQHSACNTPVTGSFQLEANSPYGGLTYEWSNPDIVNNGISSFFGPVSVTVTDAVGCVLSGSWEVNRPSKLTANANRIPVTCFGAKNGILIGKANGGTPPYTYLWEGGIIADTLKNLDAGTYQLSVTDNNGCTDSRTLTILQPSELTASATVTPSNSNNGKITLISTGGTLPHNVLWSNGASAFTLNNLMPGEYQYTITDARQCTFTNIVIVPMFTSAPSVMPDEAVHVMPNPGTEYLTIEGANQYINIITLQIFDLNGNIYYNNGKVNLPLNLDTKKWPAGTYFIELKTAEGTLRRKWIKIN